MLNTYTAVEDWEKAVIKRYPQVKFIAVSEGGFTAMLTTGLIVGRWNSVTKVGTLYG